MPEATVAYALIGLGVLLVLVAAGVAYSEYRAAEAVIPEGASLEVVLSESTSVLLNLLIKIAFLGIVLAAGSILLGKGIALLRKCPVEEA